MSKTFETEGGLQIPASVVQSMSTNESTRSAREGLNALLGKSFGGKRDYYKEFGYENEPDIGDYWRLYQRFDIATRIVEAYADTCWKDNPEIQIVDDKGEEIEDTEFGQTWDKLADHLDIYHKMERIDRLSGIGRFGVLLIGVKGEDDLSTELEDVTSAEDIIYISPYSERSVENIDINQHPGDERFGLPETYDIDLNGTLSGGDAVPVHHSRVIHIAEKLDEDEVFGTPRLKNVINRFEDLRKIVGGSAEMFWQAAERGLHLNAKEATELDLSDMQDKAEDYVHELSRILPTKNIDVTELGGDVKEPASIFDNIIKLIAGAKKIPQRELIGTERGELASQQDQYNWYGRMGKRRVQYVGPRIVRPVVDLFVDVGALSDDQRYKVVWPNLFSHNEVEKSKIRNNNAQALKTAGEATTFGIATDGEIRERVDLPKKKPEPEPQVEQALDEGDEEVQRQFDTMRDEEFEEKIDSVLGGEF